MTACPFCASLRVGVGQTGRIVFVRCFTCGARGPAVQMDESAAIRKWNEREGS